MPEFDCPFGYPCVPEKLPISPVTSNELTRLAGKSTAAWSSPPARSRRSSAARPSSCTAFPPSRLPAFPSSRLPAFTPHRKGKVERLNLTIEQT
ncbi:hypothetical protein AB0P37_42925 [Streptomyces antimycoticus]|uniref:hypothetical protein n=1 Tax=Streptomyces antimycoticus TaxID=68175 RepID=UPI003441DE86